MQSYEATNTHETPERFGFVDITDDIQSAVEDSGIRGGRVTVYSREDLCPLLLNERESGLLKDIKAALNRVTQDGASAPPTTIGAQSIVLPVVEGAVRLGTWQRMLLLELDEAAERSVIIEVIGE